MHCKTELQQLNATIQLYLRMKWPVITLNSRRHTSRLIVNIISILIPLILIINLNFNLILYSTLFTYTGLVISLAIYQLKTN